MKVGTRTSDVGDVEVGVAGGEALAFEDDGRRHGEGDDLEGLGLTFAGGADVVAEAAEAVEVFGEGEVVLVGGVGLDAGEDGVFGDEAGDVVDVAVGVVAGAAAVQPEGLVDAEVVVEGLLEVGAGLGWFLAVPRPGLRCWISESRHSSVVRRTPAPLVSMEPPSRTMRWGLLLGELDLGLNLGEVVELGDVVGDLVVAVPVVVFGPGVELPVGDGERVLVALGVDAFDEDGAGVAQPDAVGGPVVEVEAGEVGAAALENGGGAALGGEVVDEDVDVFARGRGGGRSRRRPRGWAGICRASRRGCGARRSRWRRGAPTRRACGSGGWSWAGAGLLRFVAQGYRSAGRESKRRPWIGNNILG